MAQAADLLDGDQLSCSICLNLLKDPVTIPCGHSYCMNCIKTCLDLDDDTGVYSCPQCRESFTTRPVLRKNTMLAEVVEKLKKTGLQDATPAAHCYAGPEDVACEVCTGRKRKAVKSCLVCLASYCETHLQIHGDLNPGNLHDVVDATTRLQENICPQHKKLREVYCRTDRRFICYLCGMDEHKSHDTVSAATERTEKQEQLGVTQSKFQRRIQEREKELQDLRQAVSSLKLSAQAAVEDSERIFTELIRSIERRRSEVREQIRDQEKAEVSRAEGLLERLEQEIAELRRRDTELERLLHTQDHIHVLQRFQSVCDSPEPGDLPSTTFSPNVSFETMIKSISKLSERLEDVFKEEPLKISESVKEVHIVSSVNSGSEKQETSEEDQPAEEQGEAHTPKQGTSSGDSPAAGEYLKSGGASSFEVLPGPSRISIFDDFRDSSKPKAPGPSQFSFGTSSEPKAPGPSQFSFGTSSEPKAPGPSQFSFGTSSEPKAPGSSKFSFGTSSEPKAPGSSKFSFGTAREPKAPGSSKFSFGTSSEPKAPGSSKFSFGTSSEPKAPGPSQFSFGTSSEPKAPGPSQFSFGTSSEPKAPGSSKFSFGTSSEPKAPGSSKFSFGTSSEPKAPGSSKFSFGTSSEPKAPGSSKFSFGNSSEPKAPGPSQFSFGTSSEPKAPGSSKFSFGTSSEPKAPGPSQFSFGTSSEPKAPGTSKFSFGTSSEPKAPGSSKFSFGTSSEPKAPGPSQFSFGTSEKPKQRDPTQFSFGTFVTSSEQKLLHPSQLSFGTSAAPNASGTSAKPKPPGPVP